MLSHTCRPAPTTFARLQVIGHQRALLLGIPPLRGHRFSALSLGLLETQSRNKLAGCFSSLRLPKHATLCEVADSLSHPRRVPGKSRISVQPSGRDLDSI